MSYGYVLSREGVSRVKDERSSNLELYRIFVMLLIVAHHYVVNSGLISPGGSILQAPLSWRSLFLLIFGAWGKTGINCFCLITGYFMCKSGITLKKFLKLLLEVMFYRIVIQIIFWVTGYELFSKRGLIRMLIPVQTVNAGFASTYLVFFLAIPFLNILVRNMSKRQHELLLLWCFFTYVFMGTVPSFGVRMNYVSWFMVLYMISSYIRLYPRKIYESTGVWGGLTVFFAALSVFSIVTCTYSFAEPGGVSLPPYNFVSDANTFLALANGVCSFLWFKNLRIPQNKWINLVAGSTFGVFLIHAGNDGMLRWLWKDVVDCVGHYGDRFMPLYTIGAVLVIFTVCTLIDLVRRWFIERPVFRLFDEKMP